MIKIEKLSKKYLIGHEHNNPYASLKEILSHKVKQFFCLPSRSKRKEQKATTEEFWAIQNLSLTIEEGDRVALVGRNGAGKSTLLKLLSRITEPTLGRIILNGRVSSLLEVGTGFHPELTGRENILLNGTIMGMSYQEIRMKFDEIVAFSDLEKFLDTPIKRYSSGMFMRLGFAVAAHLDSEILILDEVLAVGDSEFQKKCLNKMNELGNQGRTILFVSHNINSILSLCNKGLLLEKAHLKFFGDVNECINQYIHSCPQAGFKWEGELENHYMSIYKMTLNPPKSNLGFFYQSEKTQINLLFEVKKPCADMTISLTIMNSLQQVVAQSKLSDHQHQEMMNKKGLHELSFNLDLNLFHPGEYQIKLEHFLSHQKHHFHEDIILSFVISQQQIKPKLEFGISKEGLSLGNQWEIPKKNLKPAEEYLLFR